MVNQRTDMELPNNGRDILQLRATVKVPLFREQYKAKEREEQFRIQALEHQKDEVLDRFTAAIERAYADYETARLQRELYQRQQQITRSAIEILQASYSTAGSNFDELLRLERELIDYDLKMLKAIVKSHLAVSSIQRYLLE
jgi:outer membrane protein TolC